MTPDDLRAWQAMMRFSNREAAAALKVSYTSYGRWLYGKAPISAHTALAVAAVTEGLEPWAFMSFLENKRSKKVATT